MMKEALSIGSRNRYEKKLPFSVYHYNDSFCAYYGATAYGDE